MIHRSFKDLNSPSYITVKSKKTVKEKSVKWRKQPWLTLRKDTITTSKNWVSLHKTCDKMTLSRLRFLPERSRVKCKHRRFFNCR